MHSKSYKPYNALLNISTIFWAIFLFTLLILLFITNEDSYAQVLTLSGPATGDYTNSQQIILAPGFSTSGPFHAYIVQDLTSQNRGYNMQELIKVEGIKTDAQLYQLTASQRQATRTYVDGLGRTVQQVVVKGSPSQNDIIQLMSYDNQGRQTKTYLPYTGADGNGGFHVNGITEQSQFYSNGTGDKIADDAQPYSQQVFENSPLQRITASGNVGAGYQPSEHAVSVVYRTNLSTEIVRRWNVDGTAAANFPAGSLTVNVMTDAQGNQTITYKDNAGNMILKRQQLDGTVSGQSVPWLDTYYVFDDLKNVRFVVPPKAVAVMETASNWDLNQGSLSKLLFRYVYDDKGRQIERTVPGSAVIYMVYDPLNRLVLAQDGNLRTANKWNYIKYNSRGIAVSQGIYTNVTYLTRNDMQSYVSGLNYSNYFEKRNSTAATGYYTNVSFPVTDTEPLAYSYFDNYDIDGDGTADYSYQSQGLTGEATPVSNVRGMITALRKRTIGTGLSDIWLTSVVFYDKRGNAIQTLSNNQLNAAVNNSKTIVPDFTGSLVLRKKTVRVASSVSTAVQTEYGYDHMGRILTVDETLNGGASLRIAGYQYNEIGQLVDKKLNSVNSGSSYLQSVDFRYSIRGQLLSINNSSLTADDKNDDNDDVFGMEFNYDQVDGGLGNTAYFNGMLSAVKWRSKTPLAPTPDERSYKFAYDKAYRLNAASYADRSGSTWSNAGAFDEKDITYDENGNILSLKRNANIGGTVTEIDNLNYSYTDNQLTNVTDGTSANYTGYGFRNLASSDAAYGYNNVGSLINDPKKGLGIAYNVLNRTDKITMTGYPGRYINYTYDAGGILLRKQAYDNNVLVKTTDYIDDFIYENNVISQFKMAEGRVRNNSGALKYEYMISDNMGNVRVSFEEVSGVATVRQENSYYPFGLIMPGGYAISQPNRNLYNGGSEWQDDFSNLPDYTQTFYRNYDAALGRFIAVDPKGEQSESLTTYQYALNNPLINNDPRGDFAQPAFTSIYDIINPLWNTPYGGSWSSSDSGYSRIYESPLDGLADVSDSFDKNGGWESTSAGNFANAYNNLYNGSGSVSLRGVDISETRTNSNWLIERQKEAYNSTSQSGIGSSANQGGGYPYSGIDKDQNLYLDHALWEVSSVLKSDLYNKISSAVVTGTDALSVSTSKANVIAKVLQGAKIESKAFEAFTHSGTVVGAIAGGIPAVVSIYNNGLNWRNGTAASLAILGVAAEFTGLGEALDGTVGLGVAVVSLSFDVWDAKHPVK